MLYQDINYHYFQLENPIVVDGILIKDVYIEVQQLVEQLLKL
jgi:hypothetical protein